MIDISKYDKAEVFVLLYNNAKVQDMGLLKAFANPDPMTKEEAQLWIDAAELANRGFDHVNGRMMKVNLLGDSFDPTLYDRDNGPGAAWEALAPLKENNE